MPSRCAKFPYSGRPHKHMLMLDFGSTEETGSTYIVSDVQAAWYYEQARVSGYMRALHDVLRQLVSLQYALARADKRQECRRDAEGRN